MRGDYAGAVTPWKRKDRVSLRRRFFVFVYVRAFMFFFFFPSFLLFAFKEEKRVAVV